MTERTLPLFALNTVLVLGAPLPLHIFEQRYRRMVADLLAGDVREFVVLLIKAGDEVVETGVPGLVAEAPLTYDVGTVAHIDNAQQLPDGRSLLACSGRERVRLVDRVQTEPYPTGRFVALPDHATDEGPAEGAVVDRARQAARRVFESLRAGIPVGQAEQHATLDHAIRSIPQETAALSHFVSRALFTASNEEKQRLLEAPDAVARLKLALPLLLLEERLAAQRHRVSPHHASLN